MEQQKNHQVGQAEEVCLKENLFLFVLTATGTLIRYALKLTAIFLPVYILLVKLQPYYNSSPNLPPYIIATAVALFLLKLICIMLWRYAQNYRISGGHVTSEWGFFRKHSIQLRISDIRSIAAQRTILQRLAGAGTIVIHTAANGNSGLLLHNVNNPKSVELRLK